MATSTATVLIPGTVVQQRYVIQEVRQYHDQYRRYLALDSADRFCLITEFPIHNHSPSLLPRLKQVFEQKTAPLLNLNHPQLPRFTAAFRDGDGFFLVQEPPQGIPYRQLLKLRSDMGKTLTEPEVIHLLTHLLPALQELHGRKLIHSKLSPDSIVLPVPQPKSADALRAAIRHEVPTLVDLGALDCLARQLSALQSQRSIDDMAPIARLGYAPPEQVQTGRIYPHSDLYGLAVTCLELLTGQAPQKLMDSHTLTWSWQAYTSLSQPFEAVLSRMLAWQPGDRYATALEVLQAIQTMDSSLQIGSSRSKAGLAELNAGSILSLESWTIDSFLRPRRKHSQDSSKQEQVSPKTRTPKNQQPPKSVNPSDTSQLPPANAEAQEEEQESSALAPQWQAWLVLGLIGSTMVASSLLFAPGSRLLRKLPQESRLSTVLPQFQTPWQFASWLNGMLAQHTAASPNSAEASPHALPQTSTADKPVTGEASANSIELLSNDIPIPVYLSATSPEQILDGSLRILPSQTYFVIGQAGQRLTAILETNGTRLTVLDSELRPLSGESSNSTQWIGELIPGDRTLFQINGQGSYQLKLTLDMASQP